MTYYRRRRAKGFTLVELMIVVAIIGLLSGIAIPKFAQLIAKGLEANTKGNLGALRSALSIYFSDNDGYYPTDTLGSLSAGGKYLLQVPVAKLPAVRNLNTGHPDSSTATPQTSPTDAGGWSYDNTITDTGWGRILVACTHSDSAGRMWTSY